MSHRTHRRLVFLFATFLFVAPGFLTTIGLSQAPTVEARARQWAVSLSASGIRRAMGTVETLPSSYRSQLLLRLTPDQRAQVWRRHVTAFISSRPDLTPAQAAYVQELIAYINGPGTFTADGAARGAITRSGLYLKARALFTVSEVTQLTKQLGPADSSPSVHEPGLNRLLAWISNRVTTFAQGGAGWPCDCDWHVDADADATCQEQHGGPTWRCFTPSSCNVQLIGCGVVGLDFCHHFCQTISPG